MRFQFQHLVIILSEIKMIAKAANSSILMCFQKESFKLVIHSSRYYPQILVEFHIEMRFFYVVRWKICFCYLHLLYRKSLQADFQKKISSFIFAISTFKTALFTTITTSFIPFFFKCAKILFSWV